MRDRISQANSFDNLRVRLRVTGSHETPDGISFWDNDLDMDQLDNVVWSIEDTAPAPEGDFALEP